MEGNKVEIKNEAYDVNSDIRTLFTNAKATTESLNNNDKITVYNILKVVGFYNRPMTKGNESARFIDITYNQPKKIEEISNPPLPLPPTESEEESIDLQGEGVKIISCNIIDIWTGLEILTRDKTIWTY